jgi:phosphoribosylanthranilate isomerase
MALKTTVYLQGTTNLTEARYAAAMEVAYLGFPILDSAFAIDETTLTAILAWISGPQIVLEVNKWEDTVTAEWLKRLNAAAVYIHEGPFPNALPEGVELIVPLSLAENLSEDLKKHTIGLVVENGNPSITLATFDLPIWVVPEPNFSLSETLNSAQGIVLKGGQEERPGWKDFDEISTILEALEE